jgi:hypothetical protein
VHRLLVEGGAGLSRQFLADGLVDELELAVAPFFVGAAEAPRFAGPAGYPHGPGRPMHLAEVRRLDDIVLLRYLLGDGDGQGANGEEGARRERETPGTGAGRLRDRGGPLLAAAGDRAVATVPAVTDRLRGRRARGGG